MSSRKIVYIINPNLKNLVGHYFEYNNALVNALKGYNYEVIILGHQAISTLVQEKLPVKGVFTREIWQVIPWIPHHRFKFLRRISSFLENVFFYFKLREILHPRNIDSDTIVFCDMVCHNQVLAWGWWYQWVSHSSNPRLVLLYRYSSEWLDYWLGQKLATYGFNLLETVQSNQVCLCSDSDRLAKEYSRFTSLPIDVFPIPHTSHITEIPLEKGFSNELWPLRFVSLGDARDEKGFLEILEAIKILNQYNLLDKLEFTLQAHNNSQGIQSAVNTFYDLGLTNVKFIEQPLDTQDYYKLLHSAHVVLVPYWRSIYVSRTSGIFTEALAAGKPVIATQDTWMSDQLQEFGSGILCEDRDAYGLAKAITQVARNYEALAKLAEKRIPSWLAIHNPQNLANRILDPDSSKRRRAIVFYPWGEDILARNTGASQRTGLMIDVIQEDFAQLTVLTYGSRYNCFSNDVLYTFYHRPRLLAYLLKLLHYFYKFGINVITRGRSSGEEFMLWYHWLFRLDPAFRRQMSSLIRHVDVVFLEYTFWASVIGPICQKNNVILILTAPDVLSKQIVRVDWLKKLILEEEIQALKRASHAVCVAENDAKEFKNHGVEAIVIPHSAQLKATGIQKPKSVILECLDFCDISLPHDKKLCIFVGSYFPANVEAAENIRSIAQEMLLSDFGNWIHFVIVGGCLQPDKLDNFTALGRVSARVLDAVYSVADLVLIPLLSGTGSSLKTIESMAYGKAMLGTTVGFRGYPVQSDFHCIINDSLDRYPQVIIQLLSDSKKLTYLGENARKFAESYEYKKVYKTYSDLYHSKLE